MTPVTIRCACGHCLRRRARLMFFRFRCPARKRRARNARNQLAKRFPHRAWLELVGGSTSPQRKGVPSMFARIVELFPKLEKKNEFLKLVRTDVIPILKKQPGFLEILPFIPDMENERLVVITLCAEKRHPERYVR